MRPFFYILPQRLEHTVTITLKNALEYAKNGHSVTMGTAFDFDWDEVYNDRGVFGEGEVAGFYKRSGQNGQFTRKG